MEELNDRHHGLTLEAANLRPYKKIDAAPKARQLPCDCYSYDTLIETHKTSYRASLLFFKQSHTYHKMLQKYLLRSARTFAAQAVETRIPQASRTSYRIVQPINGRTLAGVRSYSATAEPAKQEAAPAKEGEKAAEAEAEHPHTKELEAKKKEVSEVTVCRP